MAEDYKVLGQVAPAATTNTSLYTVPSATKAVISTLVICNRGAGSSFRVAIRPAGASLSNEHYIAYDVTILANDTIPLTLGLTLGAGDVITVYGTSANFSFSVYGTEIT